jgi:hypothetical protein
MSNRVLGRRIALLVAALGALLFILSVGAWFYA